MNRRRFLFAGSAVLLLAACGDDDDATPSTTTVPAPGAGASDEVLLRTAAALSLSAATINAAAADAHKEQAHVLDSSVSASHPDADARWATAADAELALTSTFQAWAAVLSTPELRQRAMSCSAATARFYAVALSTPPSLPEAFQLIDPAVPDAWLLQG